jgi:hypothetical protein
MFEARRDGLISASEAETIIKQLAEREDLKLLEEELGPILDLSNGSDDFRDTLRTRLSLCGQSTVDRTALMQDIRILRDSVLGKTNHE